MAYRRFGLPIFGLAAALFAGTVAIVPVAGASGGVSGVAEQVSASGSTSFAETPDGEEDLQGLPSLTTDASGNASSHGQHGVNRSRSIEHGAPRVRSVPVTEGVGVNSEGPVTVLKSFDGLNHRNQRLANGGNQFSVEPPDQGLCVGNGYVMEVVNDVMRIWLPDGTKTGVKDLNTFFKYPAQFKRPFGPIGPFVTDPSCYFDTATQRWFVDVLTLDTFPQTGDFTGKNHLDLAVSNSDKPTGTWTIYTVQVQNDGHNGTPNHGCKGIPPFMPVITINPTFPDACIGDYPHLGSDKHGIYLTTNEYSLFGNDFRGAQVYAFSKSQLAANSSTVTMVSFNTHFAVASNQSGFTLWPATGATGTTEYFMSSNAADEAHGDGSTPGPRRSNQLLVWSLPNTPSLGSTTPSLTLTHKVLTVGLYVVPAPSEQKNGETPLIDCLNQKDCSTFLFGGSDPFAPEHEADLDSNDTRMQQVVFADGMLWGAIDTAVRSSANTRAGIEWFVVDPAAGKLVNSGYLAVKQNNITYPAVAVNSSGKGVIAFTLLGRQFFPSAAFASIDKNGVGPVQLAAEGLGPSDGFTDTVGLTFPFPYRPRWGDYGAALAVGNDIWIASEYIGQTCTLEEYLTPPIGACGGTRTVLANWDTRITLVNPGS